MGELRVLIAAVRRAGNRFECPICGWRFRRMLTSATGAPDAVCPRCWSAERHRLLWLYLQRETPLTTARLRVLHLAPEPGLANCLQGLSNIDYVSADLESKRAMVRADVTALPFSDHEFDMVLCSHVLEHIPDDRLAMREISRVLKPGGQAILQHPIDRDRADTFEDWSITSPQDRDRVFFQHDHVRIYGRDIENRLRHAGFNVDTISYTEQVSAVERDRYRLQQIPGTRPERDLEADIIYRCRVPAAALR